MPLAVVLTTANQPPIVLLRVFGRFPLTSSRDSGLAWAVTRSRDFFTSFTPAIGTSVFAVMKLAMASMTTVLMLFFSDAAKKVTWR